MRGQLAGAVAGCLAALVVSATNAAETVAAETVAAETVPTETVATKTVAAETVPTETVAAKTVPAKTAETVAAKSSASEVVVVSAAPSASDSLASLSLKTPENGILYVRYGTPGAVRLHRGNLAVWRERVRAVLDSLAGSETLLRDAAEGTGQTLGQTPAGATARALGEAAAGSAERHEGTGAAASLISVLRAFGTEPTEPGTGRGVSSPSGAAAARELVPNLSPRGESLARPNAVLEAPQEEPAPLAGNVGPAVDAGALFAGRARTTEDDRAVAATPTATDTTRFPAHGGVAGGDLSLRAGVPMTVASPETLRIALKERRVVQTQAILFETARTEILPGAEPMLEQLAAVLREEPEIRLRVEGHTDIRGSLEYNQKLSERRAASIRDWLVGKGIEPDRIVAIGLGESEAFDDRTTVEAYALNRRVVFRILPEAGQ